MQGQSDVWTTIRNLAATHFGVTDKVTLAPDTRLTEDLQADIHDRWLLAVEIDEIFGTANDLREKALNKLRTLGDLLTLVPATA